ncbi:hypothetical protein [Streptomyces varsoviensis]|uniref:Uncharacterized protein n=1 Tax=Streptomyces varsoviensis TaxID=67373 RepID=A0ABR5J823_9ACTN|nr:hypothetical protein [Streptomyces varsoviensis]KOG89517.1 hypothetical protein ADK38_13865 [Streptomyces varsoviensis]
MDLLDWHRGRLSSRRLSVLVRQLPRDSAVNRELHGEVTEWGTAEHLLAAITDHLAAANWMTIAMNGEEGSDPPDYPEPVPRPGDPATTEPTPGAGAEPGPAEAPAPAERLPTKGELLRFFG